MARDDDGRKPMVPSTMRVIFGIIMIIVYVGMGVLLLINYFQWTSPVLQWLRWIGVCHLALTIFKISIVK